MALANPARVHAQAIEAIEFPAWAGESGVFEVPKTIVRHRDTILTEIEGAVSEEAFIQRIREGLVKYSGGHV